MSAGWDFFFRHEVQVIRIKIHAIIPSKRPVGIEFDGFEVNRIREFADQAVIYPAVFFNYLFQVHRACFACVKFTYNHVVAYLYDVFDVVHHNY